jgi:hypothetical protein
MSMTLKDMAITAKVSRDTVERTVRRLFPDLMGKGKATHLNEHQAVAVMADLRKQGFIELPHSAEAASAKRGSPPQLTAALMRECRISVEKGILTKAQLARLLGVEDATIAGPAYKQPLLALAPPAPRPRSVLDLPLPCTDIFELALALKMPPSWVESKSISRDMKIGQWMLEDLYVLVAASKAMTPPALRNVNDDARRMEMKTNIRRLEALT